MLILIQHQLLQNRGKVIMNEVSKMWISLVKENGEEETKADNEEE